MFFPFVWLWVKKRKTRDRLAIAGFSEILGLVSEFHSLDAYMPANARPNGHASIGLRVL
jgi:hypothetical protein